MYFIVFGKALPIPAFAALAMISAAVLALICGKAMHKRNPKSYLIMGAIFYFAAVLLLIALPVGIKVDGKGVVREVEYSFNLKPDLLRFVRHEVFLMDFFVNIILLAPFGFLTGLIFRRAWKALLLCLAIAVLLESLQIVVPGRVTDINDMVYNLAGGCMGVLTALLSKSCPKTDFG